MTSMYLAVLGAVVVITLEVGKILEESHGRASRGQGGWEQGVSAE